MFRSWSVVRTHAHRESLAASALGEQGFAVVCPRMLRTVRRSRRLVDRLVPLFPGYVFVALDGGPQAWRPINSTRGVRALLSAAGGRPSTLPAGFVEEVLARSSADGVVAPPANLAPGQRVRVRSGAFAELVGQVVALDEAGRVGLLLSLMSREVRVTLPAAAVEDRLWAQ